MIAPVLTPLIAKYFGWSWGLYAGGIIMLAGVLVWFFVGKETAIGSRTEAAPQAAS